MNPYARVPERIHGAVRFHIDCLQMSLVFD
ncbi:hypothetical protein R70241_05113 [Paraburkholderia saeva]|jgi:hypothetical protein|nr:hypothetical protein R70241_05113 [Paraburkholderia saeva]